MQMRTPAAEHAASPQGSQLHEQHLPLIHHLPDVQVILGGGQYPVEEGVRQESADLVLDGSRAVGPVAEREPFVFLQQEDPDGLVLGAAREPLPELAIDQEAQNIVEHGLWLLEKGHEHVPGECTSRGPLMPAIQYLFTVGALAACIALLASLSAPALK